MWIYYVLVLLMAVYIYPHLPEIIGLTLTKIVGIIAVIAGLFRFLGDGRRWHVFAGPEPMLFLALCAWIFASQAMISIQGVGGGWITGTTWSYVSHIGFLLVTMGFLSTLKKVETTCYFVVASIAFMGLTAFKDYVRWNLARPGGIAGDPNYATLIALCVLPMCFLLYPGNTRGRKVFLGICGILIVGCCLIASSRGGVIGMAAGIMYTLYRAPKKAVATFGIGVILLGTALFVPTLLISRMGKFNFEEDRSMSMRWELQIAGLRMVKAHPLFGIGVGRFKAESNEYNRAAPEQIAHNTYLELAAELGIPALMLYLAIMGLSWRKAKHLAVRLERQGDLRTSYICRSIEAGIVGFGVASVFLTAYYIRHYWLLVFMLLAIQRLVKLNEESQELVPARAAGSWKWNGGTQPLPALPMGSGAVLARPWRSQSAPAPQLPLRRPTAARPGFVGTQKSTGMAPRPRWDRGMQRPPLGGRREPPSD